MSKPIKITILSSNSVKDLDYVKEFKTYLEPYETQGLAEIWYEGVIQLGVNWKIEIQRHIDQANLILLMISADFLASQKSYDTEFEQAYQLHRKGKVMIVPILLNYSLYDETPIKDFLVLPRNKKPIVAWALAEAAFNDIDRDLKPLIKSLGFNKKGEELIAEMKYSEAIECFDNALSMHPNFVTAYLNRGNAYYELGDYEKALADYDKTVELNHSYLLQSVKDLENIVFRIRHKRENKFHYGTAFFVSETGIALTSFYNVQDGTAEKQGETIEWWNGQVYKPAKCIYKDSKNNIAVLHIELLESEKDSLKILPISLENPNTLVGRSILLYGFSNNANQLIGKDIKGNIITNPPNSPHTIFERFISYHTNLENFMGVSGAPIYDRISRTIIGIQIKTLPNKKQMSGLVLSHDLISQLKKIPSLHSWQPTIEDNMGGPSKHRDNFPYVVHEDQGNQLSKDSLVPPPLEVTVDMLLQQKIQGLLSSPVLNAWVSNEKNKILIVGKGIPVLREQIETEILALLLDMGLNGNYIITDDLIYISFNHIEDSEKGNDSKRPDILRRYAKSQNFIQSDIQGGGDNHKDKIASLIGSLRTLEYKSGMINIQEFSSSQQNEFVVFINELVEDVLEDGDRFIVEPCPPGSQNHFPCLLFHNQLDQKDHKYLHLSLPIHLIATTEFKKLLDAYYKSGFATLYKDIKRRISFWEERIRSYSMHIKYYNKLTDDEKTKLKPVEINFQLIPNLGILVPIPPTTEPAITFYEALPKRKEEAETEVKTLRETNDRIKSEMEAANSPFQNIYIGRIFDSVLRNKVLSDDLVVNELFEKWKALIYPSLRILWRDLFQKSGIRQEEIFTQHTIFTVNITENQINIIPQSLVDTHHSTILLIPEKQTLTVRNPVDYVSTEEIQKDEPELIEKLKEKFELSKEDLAIKYKQLEEVKERLNMEVAAQKAWECYHLRAFQSMREIVQAFDEKHENGPLFLAQAWVAYYTQPYKTQDFQYYLDRALNEELSDFSEDKILKLVKRALGFSPEFVKKFKDKVIDHSYLRPSTEHNIEGNRLILKILEGIDLEKRYSIANHSLRSSGESQEAAFLKMAEAFEHSFYAKQFDFPVTPLFTEVWRILSGASKKDSFWEKNNKNS